MTDKFENIFFETDTFLKKEYGYESDCSLSGCNEEGICRCSIIVDFKITEINLIDFSNLIYRKYFNNDITTKRKNAITFLLQGYEHKSTNIYFINRILTINDVWNPVNWDFEIINGYYGQEIGRLTMLTNSFQNVKSQIDTVLNLESFKDKLFFTLELENGKILDSLNDKNFTIEKIKEKDLHFGNKKHYNTVLDKNLSHYKKIDWKNIPKGLAILDGDKYRIIDGHHRILANNQEEHLLIIAK